MKRPLPPASVQCFQCLSALLHIRESAVFDLSDRAHVVLDSRSARALVSHFLVFGAYDLVVRVIAFLHRDWGHTLCESVKNALKYIEACLLPNAEHFALTMSTWSHIGILAATNIHISVWDWNWNWTHSIPPLKNMTNNETCHTSHCADWNHPDHRFLASVFWLVVLLVLLLSGIPTIILRSKKKNLRLASLAVAILEVLAMASVTWLIPYSLWVYLISLHSTVRILADLSPGILLGASCVYMWKYLGIVVILATAACIGSPVPVIYATAYQPRHMECVYVGHLLGCIACPFFLEILGCLYNMSPRKHVHVE